MYKKHMDGFREREAKDSLTKEDIDDRIEGLEWTLDVYKEYKESKKNKQM